MSLKKAYFIFFFIILIDQISKIYIKTNFMLNQEIYVFSWFRIHFIENQGMAWGVEVPGNYGKLFLTCFRIVAVFFIGYWLSNSVKIKASNYLIVSLSMILAGAVGNIIDSVFYGVIFDDSTHKLASLFAEQPYGRWFHGKVVDMLYFPIWNGDLPSWLPLWGGNNFTFFNAIFNIADSAITIGITILILFNRKIFKA